MVFTPSLYAHPIALGEIGYRRPHLFLAPLLLPNRSHISVAHQLPIGSCQGDRRLLSLALIHPISQGARRAKAVAGFFFYNSIEALAALIQTSVRSFRLTHLSKPSLFRLFTFSLSEAPAFPQNACPPLPAPLAHATVLRRVCAHRAPVCFDGRSFDTTPQGPLALFSGSLAAGQKVITRRVVSAL